MLKVSKVEDRCRETTHTHTVLCVLVCSLAMKEEETENVNGRKRMLQRLKKKIS